MAQPIWEYMQGLNSFSGDLGVTIGAVSGGISPASAAFPASNDAIFIPFTSDQAVTIKRLYTINGSTASGNIDVGVYTQDGAKIVSSGSIAQAGTSAPQFFDVTDFILGPGLYFWAVAMNNTTGTLFRSSLAVRYSQAIGIRKQATAFALPASATFATVTAAYLPFIGAETGEIR